MDGLDLRAAKCSYDGIGNNDVIEFRAWCLVYAEELLTSLEASQQQLAEVKHNVNYGVVDDSYYVVLDDLRAQLAEAEAKAERFWKHRVRTFSCQACNCTNIIEPPK